MARSSRSRWYAVGLLAVLGVWLLSAAVAGATAIDAVFPSFTSTNVSSFQLNGNAYQTGTRLRLTDAVGTRAGSAFWKNRVSLANDRSFSATFSFKMWAGDRADGLTFCLQPNSNTVYASGGGMGYSGMPNSIAIEFDTYNNGGGAGDPNNNHVGIDINGSTYSAATATPAHSMWDSNGTVTNYAWVDYNGQTNLLEVRVSNSSARPANALIAYTVDLAAQGIPSDVYVGFTAATGGSYEYHDIMSWYFNSDYVTGGIDPVSQTYEMGAARLASSASPATIEAGETSVVTFTVTDAQNQVLQGQDVVFSAPSGGSLSATSGTTNASGQCAVTFTAPQTAGTYSVRGVTGALVASQSIVVESSSAPTVSGATLTAPEDLGVGEVVGSAGVVDPKGLATTCELTAGNDGGYFSVNDSGQIILARELPSVVDANEFTLTVLATNSAGKSGSGTVTVRVANLNPSGDFDGDNAGARVVFDQVDSLGSVFIRPVAPRQTPPAGYAVYEGYYFDITTDVDFTGEFTVTLPYDPALVRDVDTLRVLHFHGESADLLEPSSVDTQAHTVSVRASSFSDYAVAYDTSTPTVVRTPAYSGWSLAVLLVSGFVMVRVSETVRRRSA